MNRYPSKEQIEHLRHVYKPGTRVELIRMDDPYTKLKPGDKGTVTYLDDAGTAHVAWDCGSCLGVIYGEDACRIIKD